MRSIRDRARELRQLLLDFTMGVRVAPATAVQPSQLPDLTEEARQSLGALGYHALASTVKVVWNRRMQTSAGRAFAREGRIELNPRLISFGEEEVRLTLKHELAHLLAHHRAGRRRIAPHGVEWRKACADLGIPSETRCHNLPLPRRTVRKRFAYQCPACKQEIRRVKKMRGPAACLACCRAHNGGRYTDRFRFVPIRDA
jgi:SprT protein